MDPQVIVDKTGDLPALPEVAARVLELVRNPKTRVQDLETAISRDQALTAKVLRIANSAFYGVRGTISTLSRAIVVLGFNTLRSVVMASSAKGLYRTKNSCFKDKILWEHSLAVALAARSLAVHCQYGAREEAFVGGLLHDIGKVILDRSLREPYQEVLERVYNDGQSFVEAETEVLGFDHTEVGALVVARWGLAPALQEAVRLHHQPMSAETDPTLCAIVSLANSLCVKLGIGPERNPDLELAELESTLMLPLDPARIEAVAAEVREQLEQEKQLLSVA